jgi:hypothetical protein
MANREPRHTVCGKVRAEAGVVLKLRFFGMPIQGGKSVDPEQKYAKPYLVSL